MRYVSFPAILSCLFAFCSFLSLTDGYSRCSLNVVRCIDATVIVLTVLYSFGLFLFFEMEINSIIYRGAFIFPLPPFGMTLAQPHLQRARHARTDAADPPTPTPMTGCFRPHISRIFPSPSTPITALKATMAALSGRYQPLASDEQAVAELGSTGPGTRDHLQGYGQTSTRSRRFAHEDGISTNTSSRWSWLENVERWCMGCRLIQKGVDFVRTNAGLLLVASSQLFFALMNVAVKKLNSLDPPVSALEVRSVVLLSL